MWRDSIQDSLVSRDLWGSWAVTSCVLYRVATASRSVIKCETEVPHALQHTATDKVAHCNRQCSALQQTLQYTATHTTPHTATRTATQAGLRAPLWLRVKPTVPWIHTPFTMQARVSRLFSTPLPSTIQNKSVTSSVEPKKVEVNFFKLEISSWPPFLFSQPRHAKPTASDASRQTYKCVLLHISMSHACEWVTSYQWIRRATRVNTAWHGMTHMWKRCLLGWIAAMHTASHCRCNAHWHTPTPPRLNCVFKSRRPTLHNIYWHYLRYTRVIFNHSCIMPII